jgi:acetyltransferase-like isoleucine patch superfamily enzyme
MLSIAASARISPLADIEDSVRGSRIVIEDDVVIDAFVKIKASGGLGDVVIGRGTVINSGCVLYIGNGIRIGRNVLIAANCTLAPTNHTFADPDRPIREQGFQPSRGGIVIGDDVWLGANCVLLAACRSDVSDSRPFAPITEIWSVCALSDGNAVPLMRRGWASGDG